MNRGRRTSLRARAAAHRETGEEMAEQLPLSRPRILGLKITEQRNLDPFVDLFMDPILPTNIEVTFMVRH